MKHIKRKFLNEVSLPRKNDEQPLHELLGSKGINAATMNDMKIPKDYLLYFLTDDSMYTGFQVNINNKKKLYLNLILF
jgi:hypothetical protein